METPEFIEGIPTEKKKVKERFELIRSYYEKLWKDLQRNSGSNCIHNKFLDANIYIVKNESDKKTAREALHNWKSTYAVKHLKLTIGVTASDKHIQYCVNKVEVNDK